MGEDGDTSNYIPNSEWTLVHLHAARHVRYYSCCAEPYPDITYTWRTTTGERERETGVPLVGDITYTVWNCDGVYD